MLSRPILAALLIAAGCANGAGHEGETPPPDAGPPDAAPPDQSFGDGGSAPAGDDCPDRSRSVYVIDSANMLRRFDPPSVTFSAIGLIDCGPAAGSPFSMAVSRDGTAWVLFTGGDVFRVSTKDAACSGSTFKPQADLSQFGMGFASDEADGRTETLYIASFQQMQFGKLPLDMMAFTPIAPLSTRMELSGTGSGQLFGLLAPMPSGDDPGAWTVAEISKSSGEMLFKKEQSAISEAANSNFAFAAWGGAFYSFVGSNVYRYDTKTSQATVVTTVPFMIVGAGVSTCAPHAIVK